MSTIQANAILDASGGNTTTINSVTPNTDTVRGRNLIINGAMEIDQRGTLGSANTSASTSFVRSVDGNWFCVEVTDGQCSYEQVLDAPAGTGLRYSQKVTVTTADTSLSASQRFVPTHGIEGYNWNRLMWHTAEGKDVAVQFWVKSSVTGTYGFTIRTGGAGFSYCQPYTISQANTWEKKTFTIPAPTSLPSGSVSTTNGTAYYFIFGLGIGSDFDVGADEAWTVVSNGQGRTSHTNLMATNGATWQLTGFQVEQGTVHTSFEHRIYAEELALCQRYFYRFGGGAGATGTVFGNAIGQSTTAAAGVVVAPVEFRGSPSATANLLAIQDTTNVHNVTGVTIRIDLSSNNRVIYLVLAMSGGGATAFRPYFFTTQLNGYLDLGAEL
jgi:hypothetical protein